MRYSNTLSGLVTVAMGATGFAQYTPGTSSEFTTSTGEMNVPTSVVTTALPDTVTDTTTATLTGDTTTLTLTTLVKPTKTGIPYPPKYECVCGTGSCYTPEICSFECTTVYEECCSVEGADIEICKNSYTVCLGYNPYHDVFVKPTTCKHEKEYYIDYEHKYDEHYFYEKYSSYYESHYESGHYESGHYESGHYESGSYHEGYYTAEYCCLECTTIYDECCAVPGADIAICKEKYTVCLGYNPFESHPYVEPTVCKHEESYYKEYETSHGKDYYNSKYDNYGHKEEITVEECCVECTTIYDECCISGDIEVCKKEYTVCLGYNPFEVVPYVKPTVCKYENKGDYSKGDYSKGDKYDNGHKSGSEEECCVECTTIYDECCISGDIEVCKKEYTVCLGYNPFDVVPYVKPTVCKYENKGDYSKTDKHDNGYNGDKHDNGYNGDKHDNGYNGDKHDSGYKSGSEEECCVQCTTVYDECCSIDGHDIETCKSEYTVCLGYNPFEVIPYVEPTVCKHGDDYKPEHGSDYNGKGDDSKKGDYSKGDDYSKTGGDKSDSNSKSKGDDKCAIECSTVYKACCDASGAIIETCKEAYTVCLGYNPFDSHPYVEPTVCKHGKPSDDEVVIVSGGERVRPVLALIAVGAFALLC